MRLHYNILWIENEQTWLKPAKEFVEDIIEENGFIPKIELKSTQADIKELLAEDEPLKEFDLILVDFKLDKGDQGSDIIQEIRQQNIYTEVMFYSQDSEGIRIEVNKHHLDGVYCSSRNNAEFQDKFERIFKVTVKKIQHISAMRGLVMSETSALDNLLIDIMVKFYEKHDETDSAKSLYAYKLKKITDSFKSRDRRLANYSNNEDYEGLTRDFTMLDSSKKMLAVGKILQILEIENPINKKDFIEGYEHEVIKMRNNLAHAIEEKKDGKTLLVTKGGKEEFTSEKCIEIRANLKKYFAHLEGILNQI